jgi:predicted RNA-binding protein YlqC (UPF0109 family)
VDPYEALLLHLLMPLVDHPDEVRITLGHERNVLQLLITVAPGDVGRVIGRSGRTIAALRQIVKAAAQRGGQQVSIELEKAVA